MTEPFYCEGLENLPEANTFVLAVNHTNVRWAPRLLATVHSATTKRRPDLASDWLVIVGNREPRLERLRPWQRGFAVWIRRQFDRIYQKWTYNCLRLPMSNERASLRALRDWKARAKQQPSLVFPEGRGAMTFKEVRAGSGRWLATLGMPVLPTAVWWDEKRDCWAINFGAPVEWAAQVNLHDLQLGLAIADAMPPEEAPDWQEALTRWRTVHGIQAELQTH
jgi:hypothetical protein